MRPVLSFAVLVALSIACAAVSGGPTTARTPPLPADTATSSTVESPTPVATSTAASGPTAFSSRTPKPLQTLWRGDLHVHTTSSDGDNTYEEMLQRALELNFDFLAITDHYGVSAAANAEASTRCRAETRLLCIPGEELFAGEGLQPLHLLALGVSEGIGPALTLKEQVDEIHRQGGLAVAAHPARPGYSVEDLYFSGFDAMECARASAAYNLEQLKLSGQYDLPCVYNSDAHAREELGTRYTVCTVPINSLLDLKVAWLLGQCRMNP